MVLLHILQGINIISQCSRYPTPWQYQRSYVAERIQVISYATLSQFYKKHPDAKDALNNWYRLTIAADWSSFHEMKELFNSVDAVGNDRFVFNIRGNTYRLVEMIV